ncbi:ComF family protein [Phyllobacterium myrsinacearum]|uniref:ComF family protein n=1 Tax=Phyllobacterium myrsinacearum TaxID=28101 RepID=A0A839EM35_9HYPH|nr:ComF family protein [Phyllobacterium myrsinacearum]MBA8881613.1 ComF family protein [Phyllobacterium myrsinacearum]
METARAFARIMTNRLFMLLFPPTCAECQSLVSQPGSLCAACWSKVRFIEKPYCPVLGIPFSHDLGADILSAEAIADPPPFHRARSVAVYEGAISTMVHRLKYSDRTDLGPWMAGWMARAGSELLAECDVIVPVPLHMRRFWFRRFNQSAELARHLGRISGKPFEPGALKRIKPTRQQVGLGHNERTANVRGAFKVLESQDIKVRGRNVLLIDDVYTTGATVKAATRALLRGGASRVDVLTFGRVLSKELSV